MSQPVPSRRMKKRVVVAGAAGTLLEWYDFALYATLATVLAQVFFPVANSVTSVLIALATYGIGFLVRPVGAMVLGRYGDRYGRRNMLSVTMVLMGIATLGIALLPGYHQIGLAAPILLVLLRMAQGFGAGAEWSGGAVFLVEHAPEGRKGLYGAIHQAANIAGFLAGVGTSSLIVNGLSEAAVVSYGWRIAFLAGALAAVVGIVIRLRLDETPEFLALEQSAEKSGAPLHETFSTHRRTGFLIIGIVFAITLFAYTINGFPAYLAGVFEIPLSLALTTNAIAFAVCVVLIVAFGALSDRVGQVPVMIGAAIAFAVSTYPLLKLMQLGTFVPLAVGQILFAAMFAAISAPQGALYARLIPARARATTLSMYYNITVALFGGTVPFINTFLASRTGDPIANSYYLIFGAVVTTVALAVTGRTLAHRSAAAATTRKEQLDGSHRDSVG